jgi:hypothetical protein
VSNRKNRWKRRAVEGSAIVLLALFSTVGMLNQNMWVVIAGVGIFAAINILAQWIPPR